MTNVGIFVFDDVEVLDFAGPYEVFTTAARMHARIDAKAPPLFNVFTIGRSPSGITTTENVGQRGISSNISNDKQQCQKQRRQIYFRLGLSRSHSVRAALVDQ